MLVVLLGCFISLFLIINNSMQVREETNKVVINSLDITVKSASFSVGELSEYNNLIDHQDPCSQVEATYVLSGLSVQSLSQFQQREATWHFLTPPGWDASLSQGYPPELNLLGSICYTSDLGEERYCESKVSCPRTQHNVPGQSLKSTRTACSGLQRTNSLRPPRLPRFWQSIN